MQAGQTGHLVLSTLHANNALEAFTRLTEMGVSTHVLKTSLRAVLAQRLVRKVCPSCAEARTIVDEDVLGLLQKHRVALEHEQVGVGCSQCAGSGYAGRQAIYEMVLLDKRMRLALTELNADALRESAEGQAQYRPLLLTGIDLVTQGVTNMKEIFRVVVDL
jgi:MSHA biogenesis protein MshE